MTEPIDEELARLGQVVEPVPHSRNGYDAHTGARLAVDFGRGSTTSRPVLLAQGMPGESVWTDQGIAGRPLSTHRVAHDERHRRSLVLA